MDKDKDREASIIVQRSIQQLRTNCVPGLSDEQHDSVPMINDTGKVSFSNQQALV